MYKTPYGAQERKELGVMYDQANDVAVMRIPHLSDRSDRGLTGLSSSDAKRYAFHRLRQAPSGVGFRPKHLFAGDHPGVAVLPCKASIAGGGHPNPAQPPVWRNQRIGIRDSVLNDFTAAAE